MEKKLYNLRIKKRIKLSIFGLFFLLNWIPVQAQLEPYYLWNVGYNNLNGNYLELGTNLYLINEKDNILDLGLSANMAYLDDSFVAIPELQLGYLFNFSGNANPYSEEFSAAFYFVRLNASPWHVTPEVGISILSLFDLGFGYGFEFSTHDHAHLEGIKLGVNIKIPFAIF